MNFYPVPQPRIPGEPEPEAAKADTSYEPENRMSPKLK